jgi:uncharacterized membrane protein
MLGHKSSPSPARSPHRRAYVSFWVLVTSSVLAAGALYSAWGAPPSPFTGLRVAVSGLVLLASLTLAVRVLVALERARRPTQ